MPMPTVATSTCSWAWACAWASPSRLAWALDRKSTRLNSSHLVISYAVFCLKKKNKIFVIHSLAKNITEREVLALRYSPHLSSVCDILRIAQDDTLVNNHADDNCLRRSATAH